MAVTSKDLRNNTRLSSGRPLPVPPRVGVNSMMYLITGLLALLALYAVMGNVVVGGGNVLTTCGTVQRAPFTLRRSSGATTAR